MKNLLKVIFEAEELLDLVKAQCQTEKEQLVRSMVNELSEIDQKLDLHYKRTDIESNQKFHV